MGSSLGHSDRKASKQQLGPFQLSGLFQSLNNQIESIVWSGSLHYNAAVLEVKLLGRGVAFDARKMRETPRIVP